MNSPITAATKMPEVWPFHHIDSGAVLQADKFYCFCDSGPLAGDFSGYDTVEEAILAVTDSDTKASEIGVLPENLGDNVITVLTGRAFVDQLYTLVAQPNHIMIYGHWDNISATMHDVMTSIALDEVFGRPS